MSEARCSFQCDGTLGHAGAHYLYRDGVHALGLAAPAPPTLDVERLARALEHYKPDKSWMDRHTSWSRPDPEDAAAIARAYERAES